MKALIIAVIFVLFCAGIAGAEDQDARAIRETALGYMESWYHGDVDKMKESLHRELAKRHLELGYVRNTTAMDMVIYTGGGYGESLWDDKYEIEVILLDYLENIASVKVVAPHYYEYLHLVKVKGKWSILNALYRSKSPQR